MIIKDFQEDMEFSRRNRPWIRARDPKLAALAQQLSEDYCEANRLAGNRAFSVDEKEAIKLQAEILVADLLAATEADPMLWVGYSRGRKHFNKGGSYWSWRHKRAPISRTHYAGLVDMLAEKDLIDAYTAPPGKPGVSSRMRATQKLRRLFQVDGLTYQSVVADLVGDLIFVKNGDKYVPIPDPQGFDIDRAEKNLRRINENLAKVHLNLNISDEAYRALAKALRTQSADPEVFREPIDFSNRHLKRVFAEGCFQSGGRFYGGWWQHIPSNMRKHIEIEGLATVEYDYSTMQPRILYAWVGAKPPADAYDVPGWEGFRPVIKETFNQLLNSDKSSKHPNQWHRFAPKIEHGLSVNEWQEKTRGQKNAHLCALFHKKTGRQYRDLINDLIACHAPINEYFFSQVWGRTQFLDSTVAEEVMLRLLDRDPPLTALPIHDSFLVKAPAERFLKRTMEEVFHDVVGVPGHIKRDEVAFEEGGPRLIVANEELHERTKKEIKTHSFYHFREGLGLRREGVGYY